MPPSKLSVNAVGAPFAGTAQNGLALTMSPVVVPLPSPPGAPRSTVVLPKFEKLERAPVLVTEATQIRFALLNVQGVVGWTSLLLPSLPAATTTTTFKRPAWKIASAIAVSPGPAGPPRLMLITVAPFDAANRMPFAMSELEPLPSPSSTRTAMICACGATPATPIPLSAIAAAVPATCVPWRLKSSGSESPSTKSIPWMPPGPVQRLPARSGCVRSTPVSTMAITWPAPRVRSQAGSTSTPGVGFSPQRFPKKVSFGGGASAW